MKNNLRWVLKAIPFVLFGLIGIAPILVSITAGYVAEYYGYELHEGGPPDDSDLANTLYQYGVMGWYVLVTFPAAVFLSVVYASLLYISVQRKRNMRRGQTNGIREN
jgi:hypothetical protein